MLAVFFFAAGDAVLAGAADFPAELAPRLRVEPFAGTDGADFSPA